MLPLLPRAGYDHYQRDFAKLPRSCLPQMGLLDNRDAALIDPADA